VLRRLDDELEVVRRLGYPSYFLTVADVVDLVRTMGVRVAARGSGAGSLVNYLLGISGVDPIRYGLLMERFLSPLRGQLPDIDIDVESARRTEVYEQILARYGGERCTCVSMMDTYRVRHAIRDVGAALGLPPPRSTRSPRRSRTSVPATPASRCVSCPSCARPDSRASSTPDGSPCSSTSSSGWTGCRATSRSIPVACSSPTPRCSTARRSRRAGWASHEPVRQGRRRGARAAQARRAGHPDAVGDGARVEEVARVDGVDVDLDDRTCVQLDDPATFRLIQSTRTLGCFQIESPGQRELVGKFAPETFDDLIVDISLFRPGPVKSDMVTPFLKARQGWSAAEFLHDDLRFALEETCGVVVFHEQVLHIVATFTGCTLAEADEARRALGDRAGQPEVEAWFRPRAAVRGYDAAIVDRVWEVLKAFASFGFCKAHAAAFALPTYQSAWLKAHHPAAFLAGVLTHDPGMYPKRLILDDARQFGIAVLSLDVNRSDAAYRVERVSPYDEPPPEILGQAPRRAPRQGCPTPALRHPARSRRRQGDLATRGGAHRRRPALRLARRLLAPHRHVPSGRRAARRRGRVRRAVRHRWCRRGRRAGRAPSRAGHPPRPAAAGRRARALDPARDPRGRSRRRGRRPMPRRPRVAGGTGPRRAGAPGGVGAHATGGVRAQAARQSQAPLAAPAVADIAVQLTLDLGDAPDTPIRSGLPEMNGAERVRAELEVLGLDASRHVVDFYVPFLQALGVTRSRTCCPAAPERRSWSPASRSRRRRRRSGPGSGSCSSPSTTPRARSTRRSSRTRSSATRRRCSTRGSS
jgi:error-prone DNA polymerase